MALDIGREDDLGHRLRSFRRAFRRCSYRMSPQPLPRMLRRSASFFGLTSTTKPDDRGMTPRPAGGTCRTPDWHGARQYLEPAEAGSLLTCARAELSSALPWA